MIMKNLFSLKYSLEIFAGLVTFAAMLGVLQTFLIGKHFIIPTLVLLLGVIFGNLAYYGYHNRLWAKYILFWIGFVFSCYTFFALFWAKKFREIMGSSFEYIWTPLVLVSIFLVYQYAKKNQLFVNKRV
jgi:hypothetical protein